MAGKVIGKTLPVGFRGNVTRTPDTIIAPYCNVGDESIQFGEPVIFDVARNGVRKIASTDADATALIGIAVRRIGQPYADDENGWYYKKGDIVDVLLRGSIAVEVAATTGIAARGAVYVCTGAAESENAGAIVCATAASGRLKLPNAVFATGIYDGEKIAEVTLLSRSL